MSDNKTDKKHTKQIIKKSDKPELTEYFRKPYLGDSWSGKVVPKKE